MFLVNSRLGLFTATQPSSSVLVTFTDIGHLFSRSYKVILPSSLTSVISRTLVYSTYLPVAVYGTDTLKSHSRSFSWQCGISISRLRRVRLITPHVLTLKWIFLLELATRLNSHFQSTACLSSCVPPQLITILK